MKLKLSKKNTILLLIFIPTIIVAQYYLYKWGVIPPVLKGVELKISDGAYVEQIDQYVVKSGDDITLSSGGYISIPTYAKDPGIEFKVLAQSLDDKETSGDVVEIEEDSDKLIAKNEGVATIGLMRGTRAVRKANIKVVKPEVETFEIVVQNDLKYVGDQTTIETILEVDYEEFKDEYEVEYESSDESIIKINEENEDGSVNIEAIGSGVAIITASINGMDDKDAIAKKGYEIIAEVESIGIQDTIKLEEGQIQKLYPNIKTVKNGLRPPDIEYEFVDPKPNNERAITLGTKGKTKGQIKGIKIGSEKVRITCGNKSKIITINVVEKSLTNEVVNNLVVEGYEIVNGRLQVRLSWDYIKDIDEYEIYVQNDSLGEIAYKRGASVNVTSEDIEENKVYAILETDLVDEKIPSLSMYVSGKTKYGSTGASKIVKITTPEEDITELAVKGLQWSIDKEQKIITFTWIPINLEGVEYSIYTKDKLNGETRFTLINSNISETTYIMPIPEGDIDMEVYVSANIGDKESQYSNTAIIKETDSDDGNDGNEGNEGDGSTGEDGDGNEPGEGDGSNEGDQSE